VPRVVIFGAAGFIGLRLTEHLLAQDSTSSVVACDNLDRGQMDDEAQGIFADPRVRFLNVDLTNPASYEDLTGAVEEPPDELYHLAAIVGVENVERAPRRVLRVNTMAALHGLDWATSFGARRIFYASTSEVYAGAVELGIASVPTGENVPVVVQDIAQKRMTYAVSKLWAEAYALHSAEETGRHVVVGRYHNVYGARMGYEHVIPQLATRVFSGELPLRVMSPDHTRAFCHVDDAVRGTVAALRCDEANGHVVHLGNDREEVQVGDLARRILRHQGFPEAIVPAAAPPGSVSRRCPDITLLRSLTGYEPQVSLDEGLHRTLPWYRERHTAER